MSKQVKISSFFVSSAQKRLASLENCEEMKRMKVSATAGDPGVGKENDAAKRQTRGNKEEPKEDVPPPASPEPAAGDVNSPSSSSPGSPFLSPEQRQRANDNKLKAQMKLVEKTSSGLVQNMGETWFSALQAEFSKPYFLKLSKLVAAERQKKTIYPPPHHVFSFTRMSQFDKLKVVILGQDPYHGPNQAHGMCFSVQPGIPPPPSLENMYKELATDIPGFKHPGHGYLGGWAEQGVLLLNAVLTVEAHKANSHKGQGWEQFTDAVVGLVNNSLEGVVFVLWGGYAQKKGAAINKNKHHVISGAHPSPLSAYRGFFGCRHFSKCNDLLVKDGKTPIDWSHLPLPDS